MREEGGKAGILITCVHKMQPYQVRGRQGGKV